MDSSTVTKKIKSPNSCVLLLTLSCTLRCRMCHLWKNDEREIKRPDIKKWKEFIDSFQPSGPNFTVIFGGGEPLLYPDILLELIDFCRSKGFRTSLATSGYFINETMARRLVDSGLNYIALTLYSLNEEVHNFLRGMPDSHQRLMQAIGFLDRFRSSMEIAIDTVVMAPTMGGLLDMANWVRGDNRICSIFFQAVVQPFHSAPLSEWYNSEEYQFLWPKDLREVDSVIDGLIELKRNTPPDKKDKINNPISQLELFKSYFKNPQDFIKKTSCSVLNDSAFTVSPDGSVNLCPYMKPIGNIKEGNLSDIWHSKEAQERREEIFQCKKNCHHIINCWYEEESD
ncbi:radical SAM protein [Candidatus Omnitrophota bacterium]